MRLISGVLGVPEAGYAYYTEGPGRRGMLDLWNGDLVRSNRAWVSERTYVQHLQAEDAGPSASATVAKKAHYVEEDTVGGR